MTAAQQWQQRVSDLLAGVHSPTGDPVDAGARLVVFDPDGEEVFRAALARHHRFADDDQTVWIRPLIGGQDTDEDGYLFNLGVARRRSLAWESVSIVDDGVEIDLATGQRARIEPADGAELEELVRWDEFTNRLTPDEEDALRRLDADSWHGRYA
ncbi:hypothetical protein OG369_43105 [Streptomyces sp. NBC_01221]|uniref:hypothetical protein n=1 Tax=Streptomyces sp. NBC_01221 TaxID=2903782 RepID=UPI00225A30DB|nr:hypothetical protein [Streptomyces sp. NBC_01221]MCX4792027.1 hypothetical protein [Streptomyces sp. NBC_01221]MCX4792567.1 hypothetical protein [Streptomyces sp. NBC_01221]